MQDRREEELLRKLREHRELRCRQYSHPDWQKWMPIYGFFYEGRSDREGYPLDVDWEYRRFSYKLNKFYQMACLIGGFVGAVKGLEQIIKLL